MSIGKFSGSYMDSTILVLIVLILAAVLTLIFLYDYGIDAFLYWFDQIPPMITTAI